MYNTGFDNRTTEVLVPLKRRDFVVFCFTPFSPGTRQGAAGWALFQKNKHIGQLTASVMIALRFLGKFKNSVFEEV